MINVSTLLVHSLTFLFVMYFVTITLFFLVRKFLTLSFLVLVFTVLLFFIFIILSLLFPYIIFGQNTLYLSLDGTTNLLSTINNNLSFSLNYLSYFFFY